MSSKREVCREVLSRSSRKDEGGRRRVRRLSGSKGIVEKYYIGSRIIESGSKATSTHPDRIQTHKSFSLGAKDHYA